MTLCARSRCKEIISWSLHALWAATLTGYYLMLLIRGFEVWVFFTTWSMGTQILFYLLTFVGLFFPALFQLSIRLLYILIAGLTTGVALYSVFCYADNPSLFWGSDGTPVLEILRGFAQSFLEHFAPFIAFVIFSLLYQKRIVEDVSVILSSSLSSPSAGTTSRRFVWIYRIAAILQFACVLSLPPIWLTMHDPKMVYGFPYGSGIWVLLLDAGFTVGCVGTVTTVYLLHRKRRGSDNRGWKAVDQQEIAANPVHDEL